MELVFLKLWIQWSSFFWSLNPALVESWDYLQREPAAQEQILFQTIWGWHQSTVGQKSDIIGWYEVIKYFQCSLELPSWGFSDLLIHANFLKKLERVKSKNSALVLINIGNDHLAMRRKKILRRQNSYFTKFEAVSPMGQAAPGPNSHSQLLLPLS